MTISLPQNDLNSDYRKNSILAEQNTYKYQYDYPSLNGVAMAEGIPKTELPKFKWIAKTLKVVLELLKNKFLNDIQPDSIFGNSRALLDISRKIAKIKDVLEKPDEEALSDLKSWGLQLGSGRGADRPDDINDYNQFFISLDIPVISRNYQEDNIFARACVAGQNPLLIEKIEQLDDSFPVTDEMFCSLLGFENDTLAQAGADNRLYITDYVAISHIQNGNSGFGQKYAYAPKALFAIPLDHSDLKNALLPIAIQCVQTSDEANPVFTPNDGVAWDIAKTIVQIADFNYHELISHLGATHLVIEPFVVTTHRQLANNHPLKILLLPHFEGTIFINWGAQENLVADGGSFDQMFSGTMSTNRQVVGDTLGRSFNEEMFPKKIKQRGVDDPKLFYPYRDDADKLWQAIATWVSAYLDIYYKNNQDVLNDEELSAWTEELVTKGQVKGFGDNDDGRIVSLNYLKEAVTMVIFTASAQHAAVNFTQPDFSGYPPYKPAAGYTPAPDNKNKVGQDLLDLLPPLNMANDQVNLTHVLGGVYYTKLGNYKRRYFEDKAVYPILNKFEQTLEDIEESIEQRNANAAAAGVKSYNFLLPSKIPQSINI